MHNFKELVVWTRSMRMTKLCYELTDGFPTSETYGLAAQVQRSAVSIPSNIAEGSAVSIPSNIAEGSGRQSDREFARFIKIAYGSACELETQLLVAADLGLVSFDVSKELAAEVDEIRGMLFALANSVEAIGQ